MHYLRKVVRTATYSLASYPRIFIPVYRVLAPERTRKLLISRDTELVIEGYPRSANTFSVVAFQMAQERSVNIAHHLHVQSQILEGVKRSLPVMVLIRDPLEAIRSLVVRHPETKPNVALKNWVAFYSAVAKVADRVVIAEFFDVITDFGNVTQRLNAKFGASFGIFEHTEANVSRVYERIDEINNTVSCGKETHVARPSKKRSMKYATMKLYFDNRILEMARYLYRELTNG